TLAALQTPKVSVLNLPLTSQAVTRVSGSSQRCRNRAAAASLECKYDASRATGCRTNLPVRLSDAAVNEEPQRDAILGVVIRSDTEPLY
ncbi:hypothetical protein KUCAC02_015367, partial [Chaenocephalus aceratus]